MKLNSTSMKSLSALIIFIALLQSTFSFACTAWTQKADFGGPPRARAVGFSIDSKGYIGLGTVIAWAYFDFWEYDPGSDTWSQKADYVGEENSAVGFSIGSKGYIGTGFGFGNNFWEYDPSGNTWTQKTDF
ncbi:MAG: hypothetical protein IH880_05140, partial [Candidatus Marinimicrobia bacterium]|nr:hypothetical protein [Candidatus Neomarinimicrobiota bacterium]